MFTATVNTGFQVLELSFSDKVATEMRSEITRFTPLFYIFARNSFSNPILLLFTLNIYRRTEEIMDQIHTLPTLKTLAEVTHSDIACLSDSVTDIARAVGSSRTQMLPLLQGLSSGTPPQAQLDLISEIRTKLSANSALLKEAIKVRYKLKFIF